MISQASMTLHQEQVWLRNMSVMTGLHRRINQVFMLACLGVVTEAQMVEEFLLVNIEIDLCMRELYDVGVYDEADLTRMGWNGEAQALAAELEVPVKSIEAAYKALHDKGKLPQ
jgi:hypothetical protein